MNKKNLGILTKKKAHARKLKSFFIRAYREIIKSIDLSTNKPKLFERETADKLSQSDVNRINKSVDKIISREINAKSQREVPKHTNDIYRKGKEFGTKMLIREGINEEDIPSSFVIRDRDAINFLKETSLNNINRASEDLRYGVKNILIDSFENGKSLRQTKLEIKNLFRKLPPSDQKVWPNWKRLGRDQKLGLRAEFIGHTETMRAFDKGALNRYNEVGIKYVKWGTTGKACPRCRSLEGREFKIGEEPAMPNHTICMCYWIPLIKTKSGRIL